MQLCHFWSRDVHPVQNLLGVANFMKIRWFFTDIWRYIDFQNGGRPPSWNCFTTIRDHPRSLCCLSNFMSEDIAIWIFRIFGLKCLFTQAPKMGLLGDFKPLNVIIHHWDLQRHDTIRYDSVCLTCSKKLTGSQLSLPHGTNKKIKMQN